MRLLRLSEANSTDCRPQERAHFPGSCVEAVHCSCATDSMNLNGVDVNCNDFVDRFATAGCAPF